MSWPVFGTGPLPTGTSEPSPRGKRGLMASLWHGTPAHRHLRAIPAWQSVIQTGFWNGNPAHKYLSGILA